MVQPDSWDAAREVLTGLGLVEQRHPSQPRDSAWAPPGDRHLPTLDYVHADGPWSVDLHSSLDRLPFEGLETRLGSPDAAGGALWEEYARPVRVLAQPYLLAYLALHASSHFYGMTLVRLIELVLVARSDLGTSSAGWSTFGDLVERTGSSRFVFPALDLAARLVPGAIDESTLRQVAAAAPRRLRRLVGGMAPATAQRLHPTPGLRERFVWIGSFKEAWAALKWLLLPSPEESQWRRVRRALRRIVRARI